jgi:dTMP kinase
MYPGLFITLEGGDNSGKSTQAPLIRDWIVAEFSADVVLTREPGGTPLGLKLRQLIQHDEDMNPRAEALLYAADRSHHVASLVRPALEAGRVVLCDRYLDSSVAYQGAGRELEPSEIESLSLWAAGDLMPDATVLLDLDPALGASRHVGELDRIESAGGDFNLRVREGYLRRVEADPGRWLVVPAHGNVVEVTKLIQNALRPLLAQWANAG